MARQGDGNHEAQDDRGKLRQQLLDFTPRGRRKQLARSLQLDGPRAGVEKSVVLLLEDHSGNQHECRLKMETMIRELSKSESTIRRAIASLESRGLVEVERSFDCRFASVFRIDWGVLGELIMSHPETANMIRWQDAERRIADTPASSPSTSASPQNTHVTGEWPPDLAARDLNGHASRLQLFDLACRLQYCREEDRERFIALAIYVVRLVQRQSVRNPGAYFTHRLKAKDFAVDECDIRAARKAIDGGRAGVDSRQGAAVANGFLERTNHG